MRLARSIVFWCHLAVGVVVAAIVVIMSATGVLLTYQKQITAWADTRGLATEAPSAEARRLPADSLLALVATETQITPTGLTVRSDRDAAVEVALGRDRRAFVNAYTGQALGSGSAGVREFFRDVTAWHRTLAATGERRALGRGITGAANFGFLFILVTGLYLWWPRTWTRARLRNIALFRRGTRGKARDFNWHNTIGVWSLLPLIAIVASGVVMSYPWANALVYRIVGEQPPRQNAPAAAPRGEGARPEGAGPAGARAQAPREEASLALDAALATAANRMPDWRSIAIQLPQGGAQTFTLSLDRGTGGEPQNRATLTVNARTGAEVKWESFATQTPGRRLRSILRFAHTGEVLGLLGQTIAGLVSLGAVLLAYTGVALALRRLVNARRRSRVEADEPAPKRRAA